MSVKSNALQIAKRYGRRLRKLDQASRRGVRKVAAAIDSLQIDNLAGGKGAAPGSYPVPNRTGDLMKAHGFKVLTATSAIVRNTSDHAVAVHEGKESSAKYGRRPFLSDAADQIDFSGLYASEVRKALYAM